MRYLQQCFGCILILVVVGLSLGSCSNNPSLDRADDDQREGAAVLASTVAIYFLSPVPAWANYAGRGGCFREQEVQFIDLAALGRSFNLTYAQRIQFQGIYNELWRAYKDHYQVRALPSIEQEKIFYQVLEKVRSEVGGINIPEHERINVLWIDPFLANPTFLTTFAKVREEFVAQGHPMLVSTCLDQSGLRQWQAQLGMAQEDIRYIDLGFFASYQANGRRVAGEIIDSAALFKDKKVYLYLPKTLTGAMLPWENATKLRPF
ncbi:MAG: hypothetical protein J6Y94_06495 [Bacteriovoracaceae bacterium]|nr:hypothetical protein [Bacteriovoracaceae bacterium]